MKKTNKQNCTMRSSTEQDEEHLHGAGSFITGDSFLRNIWQYLKTLSVFTSWTRILLASSEKKSGMLPNIRQHIGQFPSQRITQPLVPTELPVRNTQKEVPPSPANVFPTVSCYRDSPEITFLLLSWCSALN